MRPCSQAYITKPGRSLSCSITFAGSSTLVVRPLLSTRFTLSSVRDVGSLSKTHWQCTTSSLETLSLFPLESIHGIKGVMGPSFLSSPFILLFFSKGDGNLTCSSCSVLIFPGGRAAGKDLAYGPLLRDDDATSLLSSSTVPSGDLFRLLPTCCPALRSTLEAGAECICKSLKVFDLSGAQGRN